MVSQNSYDGIDKYAADLIRHKARQLVGKAGFTEDDRPDLEQELMIDLLQRMRHFNPAKAKKTTFMARIVERHISTILEARFAQCRDWRLCQTSLNEPLDNGEGDTTERIDFLDSEGSLGSGTRETRERLAHEIRMDLDRPSPRCRKNSGICACACTTAPWPKSPGRWAFPEPPSTTG